MTPRNIFEKSAKSEQKPWLRVAKKVFGYELDVKFKKSEQMMAVDINGPAKKFEIDISGNKLLEWGLISGILYHGYKKHPDILAQAIADAVEIMKKEQAESKKTNG